MMKNKQIWSVLDFWTLANSLKTTIRSGFQSWNISAPRLESVAEHIYGTQMLAIAVNSEFNLSLDLQKVIMMLSIHEIGETVIGDITPFDGISREEKAKNELAAVEKILSSLKFGGEIRDLYIEFEENKTPEAKFCKQIDKLEAFFQVNAYDKAGFAKNHPDVGTSLENQRRKYAEKGADTLTKMWGSWEIDHNIYDGIFKEIVEIVKGE